MVVEIPCCGERTDGILADWHFCGATPAITDSPDIVAKVIASATLL